MNLNHPIMLSLPWPICRFDLNDILIIIQSFMYFKNMAYHVWQSELWKWHNKCSNRAAGRTRLEYCIFIG